MRILAVTPWVPSLRRPRSLGLLSMLAEDHEVRLVAACWGAEDVEDLSRLPFPAVGVEMQRAASVARAASATVGDRPLQQRYVDSRAVRRAIGEIEREWRPDAVYFNTLRTAQWRRFVATPRKIIDLDEFRSDYYEQVSRTAGNPVWRSVASLEARRMRREEADIVREFDRVLVSSPVDLRTEATHVRLVRSPHALDDSRPPASARGGRNVLFVGRMSYAANVQAVVWFVREVWPRVVARCPDATFDVVGDGPTRRVRELASDSVRVLGRVPAVDPYYGAAAVTVVPVSTATGVQMKLIEALTYGVPTVATPLVARQAGVRDGAEVLTADSAEEWATAVVTMLHERRRAGELGAAGRTWAARNYSRQVIRERLLEALDLTVDAGGGADAMEALTPTAPGGRS